VNRFREAWPEVEIELRADASFAVPKIHDYCEAEGIDYIIALIADNVHLEELATSFLEEAQRRHVTYWRKVRFLSESHYPAGG
jgi:hypothetical protein